MEGRRVGRYVIGPELASGGMATVHLGRMHGPAGFGKTVAIKRLHAQFAKDPELTKMFLDEARVTSGLTHPNVVMTLDVLEEPDGLYLVMEYVHGASLAQIERSLPPGEKIPLRIACAIAAAFLDGLQAAHEATDDMGQPLGIVHRDVSPQNVLVAFAGVAKIADFGIAKAAGRMHSTGDGSAKGKLSYMAPEQVMSDPVTPRTDVFAAGIVLWECLARRRLVPGNSAAERLRALLELEVVAPSTFAPEVPAALDAIVLRALEKDPSRRFTSAKEMSSALQGAIELARAGEIAEWMRATFPDLLADRDRSVAALQRASSAGPLEVASPARAPDIADTSANVTINDYLTRSEAAAAPKRMPRWFIAALVVLPALGVLGVVLVLLSVRRPSAPATVASASPTVEPPPIASSAPPPAVIVASAEPSAAPAPTVSVARARSTAAATTAAATKTGSVPRKCRIVATPDKSGRMKFDEVCGP